MATGEARLEALQRLRELLQKVIFINFLESFIYLVLIQKKKEKTLICLCGFA